MSAAQLAIPVALAYLALLFVLAYWANRRAEKGRSWTDNPLAYSLSLAVFCTAWTFYGSVGKASSSGPVFLTTYLGPLLLSPVWYLLLRQMVRVSKKQRISSIADFISARYGKSGFLGGLVAFIAFACVVPYISLQLKAITVSLNILIGYDPVSTDFSQMTILGDTAFFIAIILAIFIIFFGTQNLDSSKRRDGLMAVIVFESVFKLVTFLALGFYVAYGLYDGPGSIFQAALDKEELRPLLSLEGNDNLGYWDWSWFILISMSAILFLPRQFQVAVVENSHEQHLKMASWFFPLYLLLINLFVPLIAIAGRLYFEGQAYDADSFVLSLPLAEGQDALALLSFLGGLAAATGMIIIATLALSTMVTSNLLIPILIRTKAIDLNKAQQLSSSIVFARRAAVAFTILWAYIYFKIIANSTPLVDTGWVSFVGIAQLAPAMLGGLFWRSATKAGAKAGILAGFIVWGAMLPLPALWPDWAALLADSEQHPVPRAAFWSLLTNLIFYVGVSLRSKPSALELTQAALFIDDEDHSPFAEPEEDDHSQILNHDIVALLSRFMSEQALEWAEQFFEEKGKTYPPMSLANNQFIQAAENSLGGVLGTASARAIFASMVKQKPIGQKQLFKMLQETEALLRYTREIESKSAILQRTQAELQQANEQLKELAQMKDDFVSTVTHELRTPLTSIKSLSQILKERKDSLPAERQAQFLAVIFKESQRLGRLIDEVLDFQRLEQRKMSFSYSRFLVQELLADVLLILEESMEQNGVTLENKLQSLRPNYIVEADYDRLKQVLINLISNAIKFKQAGRSLRIQIDAEKNGKELIFSVSDNGIGIPNELHQSIFEQFKQGQMPSRDKPKGSGLGLAICKQIIEQHRGHIWLSSQPNFGSTFYFSIPLTTKK